MQYFVVETLELLALGTGYRTLLPGHGCQYGLRHQEKVEEDAGNAPDMCSSGLEVPTYVGFVPRC